MNLSEFDTKLLLEVIDHALEGFLDVDDEETSTATFDLIERLRAHKDAGAPPQSAIEPRWELRSGCPKPDKAVLYSAAESPRDAVLELLNVKNLHINVLGEMQQQQQDGKTVYNFPIHCGWSIVVSAV